MTDQQTAIVRSMTGQGHAQRMGEQGNVQVEIRTVNNKGYKCVPKLSDSLVAFESKIDALVRGRIHRGTVHLHVVYRHPTTKDIPVINQIAVDAYLEALSETVDRHGDLLGPVDFASLLSLPGVLSVGPSDHEDEQGLWELLQEAIISAIDNLDEMRTTEGQRMSQSLQHDCDQITEHLEGIGSTSPRSVEVYRQRLQGKIERTLQEHGVQVSSVDLLREVQIYADRVDIHEEIVRLKSHLEMFAGVLGGKDQSQPTGRKLDFILQEMFRETNTIGSKASDADISAHVVEVKCAIERMRELVQNLE
ncbi:MAG: YicC/YloC family endoribonuclease [Planctomycetota bacterium]|nr:YicC/YloC family endoribonuclease [Planctomycetota bacterium]